MKRLALILGLLAWAAAPVWANDLVRHQVVADGHPLALWEKRPASPPRATVLLVHGRTWSALPNFDLQVPGVERSVLNGFAAAGFAAYALDLRGYGETRRDASGWLTPERAAEDVRVSLEWIRKANPSLQAAPVLVGYSRGSQVALLMAQRHPHAVSALVLYGFPAVPRAPAPSPAVPPREANTAKAAASDFITPGAASQAVIDAYVQQALRANPVRVDWRNEEQFAFTPAAVKVPTLFLYGANDPLYAAEPVAKFLAALGTQDRSLVLLPNSDHAAHVENTYEAWLEAIVSFVMKKRVSRGASGVSLVRGVWGDRP